MEESKQDTIKEGLKYHKDQDHKIRKSLDNIVYSGSILIIEKKNQKL